MQSSECRVQNTGDSALRVLHSAFRRPLSPTSFVELKPQQTGTGLLIRHGEVATTSGSTISRAEWGVQSAGALGEGVRSWG